MWQKGGLEEGDRARGWDWVDVIRHLSQTGGKEDQPNLSYIVYHNYLDKFILKFYIHRYLIICMFRFGD